MKFVTQHFPCRNRMAFAALFAALGASAMAQNTPGGAASAPTEASKPAGHTGERMGHHYPAKIQALMAKRHADMKAQLKITPAQEGAWASFTAAMQPPASMGGHLTPEQRAEFDRLATPERIDKMRGLRNQRMTDMNAMMDKRGEATKTFYAALTPEQQKVFDTEHKKQGSHDGRGGQGHHGPAGPAKG